MDDEQQSEQHMLVAWILGIAVTIAIAVSLLTGITAALSGGGGAAGPAQAAVTPAPVTMSAPGAGAASAAPAVAATLPVKLYFDSGKADLPADAAQLLKSLVETALAAPNKRAVISGFHDKTGNAEQNAELAKNRAVAVRDLLRSGGMGDAQIDLRKPQETAGGADDREARRVEVSLE